MGTTGSKQRRTGPQETLDYDDQTKIGGSIERSQVRRAAHVLSVDKYHKDELRGADLPMDRLYEKYAKEFEVANKKMKAREESWSDYLRNNYWYDYDNDRRYKEFVKEQREAREVLHIHWVDECLDSPLMLLRYYLRVMTALGFGQGIYRTTNMWRTMDRNYVKLHGIGFGSIALWECSTGIIRGGLLGAYMTVTTIFGDGASNLVMCLWNDDVKRPRRSWKNCTGAGFVTGTAVGWLLSYGFRDRLSYRGIAALFGGTAMFMTLLGTYIGVYHYMPHYTQYPHAHDDPYWTKWYERAMVTDGGSIGVRGRII